MGEKETLEGNRRLERECKTGWDAAEGVAEYDYYPNDERFGAGVVRIPNSGSWMYVRCPFLEHTDGYFELNTGEYAYWRHRRVVPDWNDAEILRIGARYRAYYDVGSAGTIYSEEVDYDFDLRAGAETSTRTYTVPECRQALQKHHPDRGGDAEKFRLWKGRLDEARRQRASA